MRQRIDITNCSKQLFFMVLLVTSMVACGDKKQHEDLQQAFKLHQDAINIREQIADQITKLVTNQDSLFAATYKTDLDAISLSLKTWDEQLVEVPGFEEEHDHSGHDHHHHHTETELTPGQHLELQQHLLQEIQTIEARIKEIAEQI